MNANRRGALKLLLAAAVVVGLAGALVGRLATVDGAPAAEPAPLRPGAVPPPPAAAVPAPAAPPAAPIDVPCWGCPDASGWALRFRTDLDLLAPLGTGTANAATWYAAFEKGRGPRREEAAAAQQRRTDHSVAGKVLPGDDPLLREAEPWVDQATMRFYPDLLPLEGPATRIPDLLFPLTLARSWVARGMDSADGGAAMADFRRAVRLGRLLRQDDVTIIADLVGLACIRIGVEAIYERAARDGDDRLALVAAIAAGEAAPQRLLTAARVTEADLTPHLHRTLLGGIDLDLPEAKLEALLGRAGGSPDRRLRVEAMLSLALVRRLGGSAQRDRAAGTLGELATAGDAIVAAQARYLLAWQPTAGDLTAMLGEG